VRRPTIRRLGVLAAAVAAAAALTGCLPADVGALASDALEGRENETAGAAAARDYLLDQLRPISRGADTSATGDAAYLQRFYGGTNVVAVIPGTDLADRYVVVGAHYDGLGTTCRTVDAADQVCNGATDNAAGVAVVLRVARELAAHPGRRSVVVAFWDGEEDGLLGSFSFVTNPLVPLDAVEAYVNYDIQGANLLPSLRTSTFALGAETGGSRLTGAVARSRDQAALQTTMLSSIFGQGRSDHVAFLSNGIPSVFFSDSTGPCYHTAQDGVAVVDFGKLSQQAAMATRLVRDLASTSTPPDLVSGLPLATYDDAVRLGAVVDRAWADRARWSDADEARVAVARDNGHRMVAEGRAAFGDDDVSTLLGDALAVVDILASGTCDGFLAPA
jgi:hypothetical protein